MEDFFSTESLGIGPRPVCAGCKTCQQLQAGTTYVEMEQHKMIERNLVLDLDTKKWTGAYCYSMDPALLPDNSDLARNIWLKQQKSFERKGILVKFNKAFEDCICCGMFTPVSPEELSTREQIISSLVEVYKESVSTPDQDLCEFCIGDERAKSE